MTAPPPQDPGLARERTVLAWQRSGLALAGGSIVVGRLTFGSVGPVALVVVAAALVHTGVIFRASRGHYRLRSGIASAAGWPAGVHAVLLAAQVAALAALELVDLART